MARMSTHPPNHNRRWGASTHDDPSRVPYPPGETSDFAALTTKVVTMDEKGGMNAALLEMLEDCEAPPLTSGAWQQHGASYKSLAAIGYRVGMTKAERSRWYRIAEAVPLSQRHAGNILNELQKAAA